jgi:DNA-binding CsgD family transcriptional regulator
MSLPSKKTDNIGNDNDASVYNRPQVRVLDDGQWLFIRKRFRMSPRELDVAKLVCGGLSNEVIATRLGIKSATVKTHLRNVYRRIRVQRKLDMLLMFLDQSAKYANPASTITMAVVKNQAVGKSGLKTEIGGQDRIAGR